MTSKLIKFSLMHHLVLIVFIELIFSISLIGQNVGTPFSVDLHGNPDGNKIRLFWNTKGWQADIIGFNIKKRNSSSEPWVLLNSQPITIEINHARNWTDQGLLPGEETAIIQKFSGLFNNPMSAQEMSDKIMGVGGYQAGDWIMMQDDFDYALTLGFAYIDHDYSQGQEYAIFKVNTNLQETGGLQDTYSQIQLLPSKNVYQPEIEFIPLESGGIRLRWEVPVEVTEAWSIVGYKVVQDDRLISETGIGPTKIENGNKVYYFTDTNVDKLENHNYKIIPVNIFKKEFLETSAVYKSDDHVPVNPPRLENVELVNNKDVELVWNYPNPDGRIKHLEIERQKDGEGEFTSVSGELATVLKRFTDTQPMVYGHIYLYRIKVVDQKGKAWYSNQKNIYYMGQSPPPPLTGLTGKFSKQADKSFVQLSWNDKSPDDQLTAMYRISSDEIKAGNLLPHNTLKLEKPAFQFPLMAQGGREVTFEVLPVAKQGLEGEGMQVKVYVPMRRLPAIQNFKANLNPDNSFSLTWEYPELPNELQGFQIIVNGSKTIGHEKIKATDRSWKLGPQRPDQKGYVAVQVKAIGKGAASKASPPQTIRLHKTPANTSVKAPTGLKAKLITEDGKQFAELTWAKTELKAEGIKGYALFIDYMKEGIVMRMGGLPVIRTNTYKYEIPDGNRGQYTFRIAPVDENDQVGAYAETTLKLSK